MLKMHSNFEGLIKSNNFDKLIELETRLFGSSLKEIYEQDDQLHYILLLKDEYLVGYIVFKDRIIANDIYKIGIDEKLQGYGFGECLITELFEKDVTLEVSCENHAAIKFYEKYDFKTYETLKGYYKGIDGYKMIREVK